MNDRIQRAFEEFHRKNPQCTTAPVPGPPLPQSGRKVGIKHLWEVLRWQEFIGQLSFDVTS